MVVTPDRKSAYFPPLSFGVGHQLLWLSRFTGLCVGRRCSTLVHITTVRTLLALRIAINPVLESNQPSRSPLPNYLAKGAEPFQ